MDWLKNTVAAGAIIAVPLSLVAGFLFWQDHRPLPESTPQPRRAAYTLPAGPISLVDVTRQAGLDFKHNNGSFGAKWIIESLGSGAAFFDFDNDSDPDLFLANGRNWTSAEVAAYRNGPGQQHKQKHGFTPPLNRALGRTTGALYKNRGDGTFENVTRGSGLDVEMYGLGVAVGDFDNDDKLDLCVTALDRIFLFRNRGNGSFSDVTKQQKLQGRGLNTSAAWLDYDRDGRLDLFVCRYVLWNPARERSFTASSLGKAYSGPLDYRSDVCALYHNTGNGFEDVSRRAGISVRQDAGKKGAHSGKPLLANALGVLTHDFNYDGWMDIAVASDLKPNLFFRNQRNGTFVEMALPANFVYSHTGHVRAGMGIDAGDFAGDGRPYLLVGNFSREGMGLYRADHQKGDEIVYSDVASRYELLRLSELFVTFGVQFVDLDNDGLLDIFVANGHVRDEADLDPNFIDHGNITYAQRPLFLWNRGLEKPLQDVGFEKGKPQPEVVGRGLACADIDLDGDSDVLVTALNGAPLLLRNEGGSHRAVRLLLQASKGNRDALGTRIEATVKGRVLRRLVKSGYSYLSHSELPVTLGLGQAGHITKLQIFWASGSQTQFKNLPANHIYLIDETKGIVKKTKLKPQAKL
jgi:hypothetical protein